MHCHRQTAPAQNFFYPSLYSILPFRVLPRIILVQSGTLFMPTINHYFCRTTLCLRLKKSEFLEVEPGIWCELDRLGLKPGFSLFLAGRKVTKTRKVLGFNLAGKWQRKLHGWTADEGWFILTTQ